MLGGSVWRLASDDEDIIYAPDYNHRSERHLEPTVFEVLRKPFMLITGALNALQAPRKQRERDEELVETIYNTVRDDGTLVLVSDTAGRYAHTPLSVLLVCLTSCLLCSIYLTCISLF